MTSLHTVLRVYTPAVCMLRLSNNTFTTLAYYRHASSHRQHDINHYLQRCLDQLTTCSMVVMALLLDLRSAAQWSSRQQQQQMQVCSCRHHLTLLVGGWFYGNPATLDGCGRSTKCYSRQQLVQPRPDRDTTHVAVAVQLATLRRYGNDADPAITVIPRAQVTATNL